MYVKKSKYFERCCKKLNISNSLYKYLSSQNQQQADRECFVLYKTVLLTNLTLACYLLSCVRTPAEFCSQIQLQRIHLMGKKLGKNHLSLAKLFVMYANTKGSRRALIELVENWRSAGVCGVLGPCCLWTLR